MEQLKHAVYAQTNIRIRGADLGFYITQRRDLQDGFYVWIYGVKNNILLVGAFGYIVRNDNDPLAQNIPGRGILRMANAKYTQNIAQRWVRECVNDHPLCGAPNLNGSKPPLPTRVLDLGRFGRQIKLLITNGMHGDYCALSYSWGQAPHPYELTTTNLGPYQTAVKFTGRIPQTIVDAIEITRMLGIRYLWVDALCIIQHNDKDFHVEGAKMMNYYENSYVTISAAASTSAFNGIFLPRDPPRFSFETRYTNARGVTGIITAFSLDLEKERMQKYGLLEGETITTRAWTLQERVLSTRNIFYASDQMYYECNAHFLSEDGYHVEGRQDSINPMTAASSPIAREMQDMSQMWRQFVGSFTARSSHGLTDPDKNKFIAFGGLAEKYASLFGDEYIAGHWKETLVKSLYWFLQPFVKYKSRPAWDSTWPPTPYRAPSWSWAITDLEVHPMHDNFFLNARMYAKLVDHQVIPINRDNIYGGITDAYIRLNAPKLLPVEVNSSTYEKMQDFDCYLSSESFYPNDEDLELVSMKGTTQLDYQFSSRELDDLDVYALILARTGVAQAPGRRPIGYLCLLVTDNGNGAYRRIGAARLSEEALGGYAPNRLPPSSWEDVLLE